MIYNTQQLEIIMEAVKDRRENARKRGDNIMAAYHDGEYNALAKMYQTVEKLDEINKSLPKWPK